VSQRTFEILWMLAIPVFVVSNGAICWLYTIRRVPDTQTERRHIRVRLNQLCFAWAIIFTGYALGALFYNLKATAGIATLAAAGNAFLIWTSNKLGRLD
jgi:hypothetical protein